MRLNARARRQRVVTRAKVRGQRARQASAALALLFLGATAVLTVRQLRRPGAAGASPSAAPAKPRSVKVEGLPDAMARDVEVFLAGATGSEAELPKEVLARFPYLKSLRCGRNWSDGGLTCRAEPRAAVAAVSGKARRFLDDQGVIFTAPAGYAGVLSPSVQPGAAADSELSGLAAFLAHDAGRLPSAPVLLSYVSVSDGWRIGLQDGTTLLFGNMRWTGEKLQRLGQVLADGRSEFAARQLTADLRYFEDGRILLRPAAGAR